MANAMTAAEVTERLGLQKEIDTRNVDSVEADLTTGIDAAVSLKSSRQRSSSRQHSMMSNLLRVKQIYIGVNKMDSGTAGSKQEKCEEHVDQELLDEGFIEKKRTSGTHNQPKQLERRSARRTALLVEQV